MLWNTVNIIDTGEFHHHGMKLPQVERITHYSPEDDSRNGEGRRMMNPTNYNYMCFQCMCWLLCCFSGWTPAYPFMVMHPYRYYSFCFRYFLLVIWGWYLNQAEVWLGGFRPLVFHDMGPHQKQQSADIIQFDTTKELCCLYAHKKHYNFTGWLNCSFSSLGRFEWFILAVSFVPRSASGKFVEPWVLANNELCSHCWFFDAKFLEHMPTNVAVEPIKVWCANSFQQSE